MDWLSLDSSYLEQLAKQSLHNVKTELFCLKELCTLRNAIVETLT